MSTDAALAAFNKIPKMTAENVSEYKTSFFGKGQSGVGKSHFACSLPGKSVVICPDKDRKTYEDAIRAGKKIELYTLEKDDKGNDTPAARWQMFEQLVASFRNRIPDCDNLILDTVDVLTKNIMWPDIQGAASKMSRDGWNIGLNRQIRVFDSLTSITEHREGQRSYNFVCFSHLREITKDEGSTLVGYGPSMTGQFGGIIEGYFNYVMLFESELRVGGQSREKRFYMWTIPPNRLHTCKAPAFLPDQLPNDWDEFQKALQKGVTLEVK